MAYYKNVFINNADNADILDDLLECSIESWFGGLRLCPSVQGLAKLIVVDVADVITQDSEICFIKAWTTGQPSHQQFVKLHVAQLGS
jgi:hypothetical protein